MSKISRIALIISLLIGMAGFGGCGLFGMNIGDSLEAGGGDWAIFFYGPAIIGLVISGIFAVTLVAIVLTWMLKGERPRNP